MRHLYRPLFADLTLLVASQVPASPSLDKQVGAAVKPMMQSYAIPGMAIAISHKGQQHFFEYGVASHENGQAVESTLTLANGADAVRFDVLNAKGESVRNKVLGPQTAGSVNWAWDGLDDAGVHGVAPGHGKENFRTLCP